MTTSSPTDPPLGGDCDARFGDVRDAFLQNFRDLDELGAAVCVYAGGRPVVDVWGGHRDAGRNAPWERDTLVNSYSVGKGVLAALTLTLVSRNSLDFDLPVPDVWPEFAAEGKRSVTLRTLLAHRAGLPAVRRPLPEDALYDWHLMCSELASQRPFWDPGAAHGYHVNTLGYLVGEVVRRATGRDAGTALREWVTGPLEADFHFGLARSEHHRVAEVVAQLPARANPEKGSPGLPTTGDPEHEIVLRHTYFNPSGLSGFGSVNTQAWRLAQIPSTNGHGTARAIAAVYDALLQGRLCGKEDLAEATRTHSDGPDLVLGRDSRFGLGFQLPQPNRPMGPHSEAFGHWGYGGSLAFADPVAGIAFAYLTNRPGERWKAPRTERLMEAVYGCLDRT